MYIPRPTELLAATSAESPSSAIGSLGPFLRQHLIDLFGTIAVENEGGRYRDILRKRQYNGNGAHDLNVTIGIVVGVLLAAFVIGVAAFLYFFGNSIRFSNKRRRGHRQSLSSSKSSRSSGSSLPPPPPPPGPPTGPP